MINLFGISLHLYGLIIGIAIVSALQISLKIADVWKIKREVVESMAWWAVVGGIVGARVYHVIHLWSEVYVRNPVQVLYIWQGGLGIWGGVIGGATGLLLWRHFKKSISMKMKLMEMLDVMTVGLPLGQAVGRLGNWANGELYGKNGEPLFAWEAILNLILLTVLWKTGMKQKTNGKITGIYLIGYGLIRIFLENFRMNEIIWRWHGIPMAVIFGGVSILIGSALIVLDNKKELA